MAVSCLSAALASGAEPRTTVQILHLVQTPVPPREMREVAPGHWFIDFGQASFAALELRVAAPEDGRAVTVHLGEARAGEASVERAPVGSVRYHRAEIRLKAGTTVYRPALPERDGRRMPAEIGAVMPFRYAELENAPTGLKPEDVRQVMVHYPFEDEASAFECSDAALNAVWRMCKHTIKATSFCGVFVDGDRERLPYEADAYINQLGWYACTPDTTLPRYSHEYLIQRPTWPTEWILFSVLMAWEDYAYTGDAASARAFYEDLQAKTLLDLARPDGLISTIDPPVPEAVGRRIHIGSIRDIVDWPAGERDGHEMKPVNTVVNAFHARALDRMARLAAAVGKPEDAARYAQAAARASAALNAKLWDAATGLYVDGEGSAHSSLHANLFPLAFGLVPEERRARVTEFVRSRGMACSVYAAQFLLDALFENGEDAQALALITAPGDRSWRHMVEGVGATMALEAWDAKYKPNLDWNHAWGAAPANLLPRHVLGVQPVEPGFAAVRIAPRPGKLAWASGLVPTVRGGVRVRFDNPPEGPFVLKVAIPAGMRARAGVPWAGGARGRLTVDGVAAEGVREGGHLFVDLGPGEHTVAGQPWLKADPAALKKWQDMRFGMFIHWGPVSLTHREIGWSRGKQTPVEEYDNLYKKFNPVKFNAGEWADIAKAAGMKYVVLTTKHHDGFCMFATKETEYSIMQSPLGRDVTKELADACRQRGIAFGTYYSVCDWHHPDFPLTSPGGHVRRPKSDLDAYNRYLLAQIRELIVNCGPLLTIWNDVPQEFGGRGRETIRMVRQLQPDILINDRTGDGGDYGTPEQQIGGFDLQRPWESCMTISAHGQWAWGGPQDGVKPLADCLLMIIRAAGGNGNVLLNVGPTPEGIIEPCQVERLREIGAWLAANGEAIYGTRGGPFKPNRVLCSTHRDNFIYVHVLHWTGDTIVLPPVPRKVVAGSLLAGGAVDVTQDEQGLAIRVAANDRQAVDTVIKLELDGPAGEIQPMVVSAAGGIKASASNVFQHMNDQFGPEMAFDGDGATRWATDAGTHSAWISARLARPRTLRGVRIHEECGSRVEQFEFQHRVGDEWKTLVSGTTLRNYTGEFTPVEVREVRLNIIRANEGPTLSEVELID